jgi:hypothetical protein
VFNPFKKLTTHELEAFLKAGYHYGAIQHYKRAFINYPANEKTGLLMTVYKYPSEAQRHLDGLEDKRHAAIIHLNHTTHFLKITQMLAERSQYLIFNSSPSNLEDILKKSIELLQPQLLEFLNRGIDINPVVNFSTAPVLEIYYGEFFICIGKGYEKQRIKVELIA